MKKYESYRDGKRIGLISNFNPNTMKKAIANSLAGIIVVLTLAGCSLGNGKKSKPQETPTPIQYASLDEEIKIKEAFVSDSLIEVNNNVANLSNIIYNKSQSDFNEISDNEEKLDPKSELGFERKTFYPETTDEEIKRDIIDSYDNIIERIEDMTSVYEEQGVLPEIDYNNYVEDYQETHKQCK